MVLEWQEVKKQVEWWREHEKMMRVMMQRARPSSVAASSTAPSPCHLPPFRGSGGSDYSGGWVQRCWSWQVMASKVCGGDHAMRMIPPYVRGPDQ